MILYRENKKLLRPQDFLSLSSFDKNEIHNKLDKGLLLFQIPDTFDKNESRAYKFGFLYELGLLTYPLIESDSEKKEFRLLLLDKYHFFIGERKSRDLLKEYFEYYKKLY